ncbi:3D-(3,5/4)-trihydroxycyclohexane-1,2-dione acylhydrolase (decyclizing) [Crassaminicella profunda]|uniref:3D-(3,5/4)-trihydroxycyclohexane-1,2-dione acylhydrolase (decyclizing) n=1 Tax=Crassaminicella profunda TaxID=1286698 RepID=UPI001CA63BEE|nr:3D-(3,5/4)-trihydroxycyclohexane-1,2-dione acylhydrolase (decyclizing) [Crassaminicella profunda]QZY55629.1 3D-(3,5/4)-trihydroxycyclohexane-1,2-dione acylhydrolase (decyclizing) [Crassaminicella profunda]
MQTVRLTMAQALVKFLNNQYISVDGKETKFVKGVMGIFGHGNVVGLGQALEQYKDEMVFYQGKNEQEIAHVAMAYAKQKNRKEIFACTASIGPGSLNMVTAAGTATVNRIPLLLLPSDAYACRQPDPVLQQVEDSTDHNVTASDAFKPVSKYWDRVARPEQLMTAAINAMRVLTDPAETGAVTLSLPQDVQGESYDYPVEFFKKRVHYIERRRITENALNRAVELIASKKKPMLICGGGVRYSGAGEELKAFAKKFNIPFSETQAGKGTIPWDYEMNLGGGGVCGTLAANLIAKEADLIIAVGTRLNDFVSSSKFAYQNKDVQILSINVNSMDATKMESMSVVADAKDALAEISKELEGKGYKAAYTNEIKEAKDQWNKEWERFENIELEEGLSQTRVLTELNKLLDEDAIVVSASGSLPSDLERVWRPTVADTYHLEYGFSCMGYEISGALGAKIAEPGREVYTFVGDGGFMMGHSDLHTSLQEGKKINILLFDNNGHQCIHNLQRSQGIDTFGTVFKYREEKTNGLTGADVPVSFATIARGYGAKAYTVTTLEELKEAIEASKKDTVSTLIEIKVLPGTMTGGYESFWRVGTAQVAENKKVEEAAQNMKEMVAQCKPY